MTIDFQNRIDENEEIVELDGNIGFNFQLFLQDNEYEELLSRSSLGKEYNDMDYLVHETDVTIDATANLYEDKAVSITIVVQDDLNGWKDDEIMIAGEEAVSLLQSMRKAAVQPGYNELLNLIDEALDDRTARIPITEFPNPEIYLADQIEQYMYERGEYDFPEKDTVRWIEKDSREATAVNIAEAMEEDIISLDNYFVDEMAELDESDELLALALGIRGNLKQIAEKNGVELTSGEKKKSDMERE